MNRTETLNGWSEADISRIVARTQRSDEMVRAFCRSVDKRLFLMLNDQQRRATLYFHLGLPESDDQSAPSDFR